MFVSNFNLSFPSGKRGGPVAPGMNRVPYPDYDDFVHLQLRRAGDEKHCSSDEYRRTRCGTPTTRTDH